MTKNIYDDVDDDQAILHDYTESKTVQSVRSLFFAYHLDFMPSSLISSPKNYLVNLSVQIIQSLTLNYEINNTELNLVTELLKKILKLQQHEELTVYLSALNSSILFSFYLQLSHFLLSQKLQILESTTQEDINFENKALNIPTSSSQSQSTTLPIPADNNDNLITVDSCTNIIDEANTLTDSIVDSGASSELWDGAGDANSNATLGIDFFDGFCSLFVFLEFLNGNAIVSNQHKIKKGLNIFAGKCSFITALDNLLLDYGISALNIISPVVVPLALATTSIQLVIAAHDHYKATKMLSFEGWLEETIKEVNHINNEIDSITKKLPVAVDNLDMLSKLNILTQQKKALLSDIEVRSRVYYHAKIPAHSNEKLLLKQRQAVIEKQTAHLHNNADKMQLNTRYLGRAPSEKEIQHDSKIQQRLQNNQKDTKFRLYLRAGALLSMSLLLLGSSLACPPLFIIASIFTYLLVTQFICNYIQKLIALNNQSNTKEKNKVSTQPVISVNKFILFASDNPKINEPLPKVIYPNSVTQQCRLN